MIFKKLIINNYRQYKDIEFDFNDDINILEAENGIGKSTFMSTIIFALYGIEQVRKSGLIEDMSYMANEDNVSKVINSISFIENMTTVTLIVEIKSSKKIYEITRKLDNRRYMEEARHKAIGSFNSSNFEKIEVYEVKSTSKPAVDISDVTALIPENIAPLLFFDGERINSIENVINSSKQTSNFKDEIEKILNIETYEEALNLITRSAKSINASVVSKSHNQILAKEQRECDELEDTIKFKSEAKDKIMDKLDVQEKESAEYEDFLNRHKESLNLQKERNNLNEQLAQTNKLEYQIRNQLFESIWRNGPSIVTASVFKGLNEILSTGKSLYEISGMEQKAVSDILVQDRCICGTPLNERMREKLEELQETLPPESFEAMLKSEIANSIDLDEEDKRNTNLRADYGKAISTKNKIEREIKEKSEQIQNIGVEEVVSTELKYKKSKELEAKYKSDLLRLEGEIKALSGQLQDKRDDLSKYLSKEKDSDVEMHAKNVLDQSAKFLRNRIKIKKGFIQEQLEIKVNSNIKNLMRDNVKIELRRNLTPIVKFDAGATSASSGQNVMISLSYLLGLMQIAKEQTADELIKKEISYPIVMDGITAKLDINHTHSMVRSIIEADTQIIFLANDQMLSQLETSILELSNMESIDDKLITLRRDKNTNVTYKVAK